MKKFLSVILAVMITLSVTPIVFAAGTTYYIDGISGSDENTLPGFVGGDDPIKSYQLAKGSPFIGAGFEVKDGCMTDFYGNEITSNNIGCYSADGEDAELKTENIIEKIVRIIRQAFNIAIEEIRKLIIDIFE